MALDEIKAIAQHGMELQRLQVKLAGLNIANANVAVASPNQTVSIYKVKSSYTNSVSFEALLQTDIKSMRPSIEVDVSDSKLRESYEPTNPLSNGHGMVFRPDIDTTQEMLDIISAKRAYESNVRVYNAASAMSRKALEIGSKE